MAHEIRNPLGLIRNYNYLLKCDSALENPRISKSINQIEVSVDKASSIIDNLLNFSRLDNDNTEKILIRDFIDEILSKIKDEFDHKIDKLHLKWKNIDLFNPHLKFIETAMKHYTSGDYLSSISVLYPRIEGIMRGYHLEKGCKNKATQGNLIKAVTSIEQIDQKQYSLLLPEKFHVFLKDVYFASFDPIGEKA